jgi:hypothetical protein
VNLRRGLANLALLIPALFAALVGAPLAVVVILAGIATLAVLARVLDDLLFDRSRDPAEGRRSLFATAAARRVPPAAKSPSDLRRMETLVAARIVTAAGVHFWLRPLLVDLTTFRLRRRGGAALGAPGAASAVPEPLWSIVRPDRTAPEVRDGPGIDLATLNRAVDELEAL